MARRSSLDLSGLWRATAVGDDDLARRYHDDDVDDRTWPEVAVPGHWRSNPAFADHDGPLAYRTRFDGRPLAPGPGERSFLVVEGVLAAADVWLDGTYLGDTPGYVVPRSFEITDLLRERDDHLLAMAVAYDPVGRGRTRDLTGAFGRSALLGGDHNPGGIWRPVRVHTTGPVRIRHCRLRCPRADATRALLTVRLVLDCDEARTVTVRTWVARAADDRDAPIGDVPAGTPDASPLDEAVVVVEREHPLATGENRIELTVTVPRPALWWPRALGEQPLHDVGLEVLVDDEVSDEHRWRTGLREVRLDDFVARVNGERLFLKGAAVGPTRQLLAEATPDEVAADVRLAADAGLDLLRVHGHLARPELYAEADRCGVLLWQDLPIQWAMARQAKGAARELARAAVDELAHHPSLLLWCTHHEPWAGDPRTWRGGGTRDRARATARRLLGQALPSWNRTVLDHSLAETVEASDGSRPVIAHTGVWPHLPQLSGSATHLWAGWRWGRIGDLARLLRWWPRVGRFVAELGAQAPGGDGALLDRDGDAAERWPALDWEALAEGFALELPAVRRQVRPEAHASLEAWTAAAQAHQAEVVRSHVETLRRLKYRPTGGFAVFALADVVPGATASLLDHERRPKPAWSALVDACAPVVVAMDRPPEAVRAGDRLALDVHVVNDLRTPVDGLRVRATVAWADGPDRAPVHRTGWTGDVPADAVARVGTLSVEVPPPPGGPGTVGALELRLVLEGPDGRVRGRRTYRSVAT